MASDSGANIRADNAIMLIQGVRFPATQVASANANQLDDYQEGTWTPVLSTDSTDVANQDGTTVAKYTKIGRMVFWEFSYVFDGGETVASGTYLKLRGFPESPSVNVYDVIGNGSALNAGVGVFLMSCYWQTDRVFLYDLTSGALADHDSPFAWGSGDKIVLSGQYSV